MAMSLALLWHGGVLTLIAAFENGYASVHCRSGSDEWTTTYRSQAHEQPVLSLDVHPSQEYFFTSSADSNIAKHPIPTGPPPELMTERTGVAQAKDEKKPLSSIQFKSGASASNRSNVSERQAWEHPLKVTNSKHAGQQGLRIRSDGRIFATAGWDSKVRVYSCKTMKELAVLEWHKTGCYAIAFACLDQQQAVYPSATRDQSPDVDLDNPDTSERSVLSIRQSELSVKGRRIQQARGSHWIAAGAKDGRVSLWDVY
jgi:ASTRA-associated protein 1